MRIRFPQTQRRQVRRRHVAHEFEVTVPLHVGMVGYRPVLTRFPRGNAGERLKAGVDPHFHHEGPNSSTRLIMAAAVEEASRALKTKTYIDETHQSVFVTLPTMRKEEVQQRYAEGRIQHRYPSRRYK